MVLTVAAQLPRHAALPPFFPASIEELLCCPPSPNKNSTNWPSKATTASRWCVETFADLDTPLSLYLKLANQPFSYLLESVQGGERFGRYSFIGLPAETRITRARQIRHADARRAARPRMKPTTRSTSSRNTSRASASRRCRDCRASPAGWWAISATTRCATSSRGLAARQQAGCAGHARHPADADRGAGGGRQSLRQAHLHRVRQPGTGRCLRNWPCSGWSNCSARCASRCRFRMRRRRSGYEAKSEFGEAGIQGRPWNKPSNTSSTATSCRWCCRSAWRSRSPPSPLSLYRALRSVNPSPYMFYYDMGDHHVVGASPEILVRLEGDNVTVRPIAGTRPRGKTQQQDAALADRTAGRSQGTGRAPDADRSGPQRRRPRGAARHGAADRKDGDRALFARDAHRVQRRGHAQAGAGRDRRAHAPPSRPAR